VAVPFWGCSVVAIIRVKVRFLKRVRWCFGFLCCFGKFLHVIIA